MIDLALLASAINDKIGADEFAVYLNTNAFPDDIGDRQVVTMSVLRVPYGFTEDELDAETLTVTLTFDLPCDVYGDNYAVRGNALNSIADNLLGKRTFFVPSASESYDGARYIVHSYFEQQPPAPPYVDSGRITQQIVVTGQVLVQNENCKILVGNDVKIYIAKELTTELKTAYTRLLKMERVSSMQVGTDNNIPLSSSSTIPMLQGISRTHTKTLTFLYRGADIETEFLQIAEGADFDVNTIYYYKAEYGLEFTIEVPFKLISVTTQDSNGVYLQYTLTIQTIEEK